MVSGLKASLILRAIMTLMFVMPTLIGCSDNPTSDDDGVRKNFTVNVTVLKGGDPAARRTVVFEATKTDLSGLPLGGDVLTESKSTDSEGYCRWEFVFELTSTEKAIVDVRVDETGTFYTEETVFNFTGPTSKSVTVSME